MTAAPSGRRRNARAPRGAIARDQIIEAALRLLARGAHDQLTVRALAAELDVAPMSLYRHIESKDDVLDEAVDILLRELPFPRAPERDWRRYLTAAAVSFRDFLVSQPAALHVYLRHPVVSPAAIERMEAMLRSLRSAGCSAKHAERAYATIHTYTIGFAALEANREAYVLPPSDSALEARLAAFTTSRQFRDGLTYLLDGIEANIRDHAAKSR
jgi:AcrR family transcriptional regulator